MPGYLLLSIFVSILLGLSSLLFFSVKKRKNDKSDFKSIFESIWKIEKAVLETVDFEKATGKVVNIILTELGYVNYGYEVIVLTLLDQKIGGLKRIAISNTEAAGRFIKATPIPFSNIIIPMSASENLSIKSINERRMFVTKNVSDVLYPAIDKNWVENFQNTLGIKVSIVYPIIAKDKVLGTLIFSLSKSEELISKEEWTILDSFVGAVGIALDNALLFKSLTDTTEQLRVANERLKEVDELKDEFVSLASHELRTPMTVVKSYVWMLVNGKMGELNQNQKIYLDRIFSSTERLIKLVNDMLNISRIESGRLTIDPIPTDIGTLVSEVITEMQTRSAEVGVHLSYTKPHSPLIVKADVGRIKEVLINLIGNSLKFTPKDGSTIVTVDSDRQGFVLVKVKDTGRGISSNDMSKLFQKFNMVGDGHLTKDRGQGTGLGLYLSKSLVELHGGRIWAESEGEGKGATFSFTLPIDQAASAAVDSDENSKINTDLPRVLNPQG